MQIEIIISGIVQGVWFRKYASEKAKKLHLNGYVVNLPNGNVKIVCDGENLRLNKMIDWCHIGSPSSKVENVEVNEIIDPETFSKFKILR